MLMLILSAGEDRYALDATQVVEVVPSVELRTIPHAPACVSGLLSYRGLMVPIIDVCRLLVERAASPSFSSRIALVSYPATDGAEHTLGLRAERVTDAVRVREEDLVPSNIGVQAAPYLGAMFTHDELGVVQCLRLDRLLPDELRESLFVHQTERP